MKTLSKVMAAALFYSAAAGAVQVDVESQAATFEEAKRSAFKQAIERATGVLTISEQEVSGYRMTRDYIGSYSSGWINNYQILEAYQLENGRWYLRMTADVRDSKVKMHSARRNTMNGQVVNGQLESDRLNSQIDQRNQGDQLLSVVMRSYPENAYVINQGQTEFAVGRIRNPYIDIPYDITMSQEWVASLKDALSAVAVDEKQCNTLSMVTANGISQNSGNGTKRLASQVCGNEPDVRVFIKHSGDWFPKVYNYYLPDEAMLRSLNSYLQPNVGRPFLAIKVDMQDGAGKTFDSRCTKIDAERFVYYNDPRGSHNYNEFKTRSRPNFMGQNLWQGTLRLNLSNAYEIENLSKIKLSIQNSC